MNYNKLPADPIAIVLGIISLVISAFGCCCGLFAVGSLILSIIGLVMANRSIKLYRKDPENYSSQSRSNTGVGQIICIVGVAFSGIFLTISIIYFSIFGSQFTERIMENYNREKNKFQFEERDTLEYNDFEETDSIYIDSVGIE